MCFLFPLAEKEQIDTWLWGRRMSQNWHMQSWLVTWLSVRNTPFGVSFRAFLSQIRNAQSSCQGQSEEVHVLLNLVCSVCLLIWTCPSTPLEKTTYDPSTKQTPFCSVPLPVLTDTFKQTHEFSLRLRSFITEVVRNLGSHITHIAMSTLCWVNLGSLSQLQPNLFGSAFVKRGFIQVPWGGIEESGLTVMPCENTLTKKWGWLFCLQKFTYLIKQEV